MEQTVQGISAAAFISWSSIEAYISRGRAGWAACTYTWSALIDDNLCALRPLIQSRRKHDENEPNQNINSTTVWDTWVLVAYLLLLRRAWGGMIHPYWVAAWASYKSKNIILDWIADLSCARSSIIAQEIPVSESCSLAMNTWVLSQSLTLWDVDLMCAWTSIVSRQTLRLCYKYLSPCPIFWPNYRLSPRLTVLPNGMGKYAEPGQLYWYGQDSPVHGNFDHRLA